MIKKIIGFLLAAALIFPMFGQTTYAYAGGLLAGSAGVLSTGGSSAAATDGNTSTNISLGQTKGTQLTYTLPDKATISSFRYNVAGGGKMLILMYNDANALIYTSANLGGGTIDSTVQVNLSQVKKVVLQQNLSGSSIRINEFDVFGSYSAPTPPGNLTATAARGQVALSWEPSTGYGAIEYWIYRNGTRISTTETVTGTSYTVTGLSDNVTYKWEVLAYNGQPSAKSNAITTYFDAQPRVPVITAAVATSGKVDLTWDAAENVTGYNVYRNGVKVNGSPITTTSYTITGLADNTFYTWQVTGVNDFLESAKSAPKVTNSDTIPPDKPGNIVATPKPNQVLLEWIANKGDGTIGYYVFRDGVRVTAEPVTGTAYLLTSTPGVNYQFRISAVDAAGNESTKSDPVTAAALIPPDVTPPAAPTGLNAVGNIGYIRLTWNENGEPDLDGYFIYQNGKRLNSTPVKAENYNVFGGLTYGIGYKFEVSAVDLSGNESPKSNSSTAAAIKPADTTAPDKPSGFTGTVSNDALKILLSWAANVEPDLGGYNLYASDDGITYVKVNAAPIEANDYSYNGIEGNTRYYFKLTAIDVNGNESKQTAALSIKTPTREPIPDVEETQPKLIINWAAITGAVQYLVYYQDHLYAILPATQTSYEIPLADGYNPEAERQKVVVKAKFIDGSIGTDPPKAANAAKKWGFSAGDIFTNSMFLVGTVSGFVLLGIVVMLLPYLIRMIREAIERRKGVRT